MVRSAEIPENRLRAPLWAHILYCVIEIETLPSRSQTVSGPFNRSIYDLSR